MSASFHSSSRSTLEDQVDRFRAAQLSRRRFLQGAAAAAMAATLTAARDGGAAMAANANTAIYASVVDIPNIDSAQSAGHDGATSRTEKHLYDTLYRHLGSPPQLVPWLATSYTASEDAKEWAFKLDPAAKFQDGSPVTADAVVFSAQRLLKLNQGVAYMFTGILESAGVTAVDAQTVKFSLTAAYAPFLHATAWLFILNPAVVKQNEKSGDDGQAWLATNSAGSGPFKIARWEQNNIFQFDADPNYWKGWPKPHVDSYVHQVMHESTTERIALSRNTIQQAEWLSVSDKKQLEKDANIVVPKDPSIATYVIKMNNSYGPTSDLHVRRAISYAFDYDALIKVMSGYATTLKGPLPPSLPGADASITGYTLDMDKAKAELAQSAQYGKGGFELDFIYVTGLDEERQTGLILLNALKELNITVKVTAVEWTNAVASFAKKETSPAFFPIYSGTDFPDPDNYLFQSFHSSMNGTWQGADQFSNPDVDKALVEARSTVDANQRTTLYNQIQQTIVDQAVEIWGFVPLIGDPYRKEISGYVDCPVMGSAPWWYEMSMA